MAGARRDPDGCSRDRCDARLGRTALDDGSRPVHVYPDLSARARPTNSKTISMASRSRSPMSSMRASLRPTRLEGRFESLRHGAMHRPLPSVLASGRWSHSGKYGRKPCPRSSTGKNVAKLTPSYYDSSERSGRSIAILYISPTDSGPRRFEVLLIRLSSALVTLSGACRARRRAALVCASM